MSKRILGLDIGGANLKAATSDRQAASEAFALWMQPDRLPATLAQLVGRFPDWEELAVTMTGESCDCFETRREGVHAIIAAVRHVSGGRPIHVWSMDGRFLNSEEADQNYTKVASANWHALATFAGQYVPRGPATLVDMGSTTTDVIPMLDGKPIARGETDAARLQTMELVYTGARRTPVIALVNERLSAEFFATTQDVYLWLGMIAENANDQGTADHRPATRARARTRLARMLGADDAEVSDERIQELAESVRRQQLKLIETAYDYTYLAIATRLREEFRKHSDEPPRTPILCGSGEFLLRHLFTSASLTFTGEPLSLGDQLGPELSACAPAYAVAVLAAEGVRPPNSSFLQGWWPWSGHT